MSFKCPSCNSESISLFRKYIAAPSIKTKCPKCGVVLKPNSLAFSILILVHYFYVIIAGFMIFFNQTLPYIAGFAFGWLILDIIRVVFVPLETNDKK